MNDFLEIYSYRDLGSIGNEIIKLMSADMDYYISETKNAEKGRRYALEIGAIKPIHTIEIAEILGDWIVKNLEPSVIEEILSSEFCADNNDKQKILDSVDKKNGYVEKFCNRKCIVKKLTQYLSKENSIIIEGFVRFRLTEYRERLCAKVYEAIEELWLEREYREFIELLKLYISNLAPMIDLIQIKKNSDGKFEFFDLSKKKIEINIEKSTPQDPIEIFLTNDDMLLSILIALAPRRIILHESENVKNKNIIKTFEEIFGKRFSLCGGCDFCCLS